MNISSGKKMKVGTIQHENEKWIFYLLEKKICYSFTFGDIFRGQLQRSGTKSTFQNIFIYRCYGCPSSVLAKMKKELDLIDDLKKRNCGQNIIKFYGYFYDPNDICFYLCMEYFDNAKLLDKELKKYDEVESLVIIRQIASALSFLGNERVWLKNFSFNNIFIDSELKVKIWDIGMIDGIFRIWNGYNNKLPMYAAPEMFISDEYNKKNESWSLGVVLYRLLYKELPFKTKPIKSKKKNFIKEIKELGDRISQFGLSEIEKTHQIKDCWSNIFKRSLTNRNNRMTSQQLSQELADFNEINLIEQETDLEEIQGREGQFEKLRFVEKRNEVCFLFVYFLQQIMKKSENLQQLFLSKFEVLLSYVVYKISSENILKNLNQFQGLVHSFQNKIEIQKQIDENEDQSFIQTEENNVFYRQKEREDEKKYLRKLLNLKYKINSNLKKVKCRIQNYTQQFNEIWNYKENVSQFQTQLKEFLTGIVFDSFDQKYILDYLSKRMKSTEKLPLLEKKLMICLTVMMEIMKKNTIPSFRRRYTKRLKTTIHLLMYSQNEDSFDYIEENIDFLFTPWKEESMNSEICLKLSNETQRQSDNPKSNLI